MCIYIYVKPSESPHGSLSRGGGPPRLLEPSGFWPRWSRPVAVIWEEAICTVSQQVGSQILGLRHHGPNQNLTRCSTRALNGFEEDIAPGVEEPIGITQHDIIRFRTLMIESIRPLQIDVQSLTDHSFTKI